MENTFAVVTGASSGIGYSLAKELATRGYDLVLCAEDDRLNSAVMDLEKNGVQVTAVQADLGDARGR